MNPLRRNLHRYFCRAWLNEMLEVRSKTFKPAPVFRFTLFPVLFPIRRVMKVSFDTWSGTVDKWKQSLERNSLVSTFYVLGLWKPLIGEHFTNILKQTLVLWRCLVIQQFSTWETRPLSSSGPNYTEPSPVCLKKADLEVKISFCDADYDNRSVQTLESSFDREIYGNTAFDRALQFSIVCLDCF